MRHVPVLLRRGVVPGGKVSACQDRMSPPQGEGPRRLLRASHLRYGTISLGLPNELRLFKISPRNKILYTPIFFPSRNISVGTETILFTRRLIDPGSIAGTGSDFSLLFSIQTGPGTHSPFSDMSKGILLSWDKVAGA
jgi:hypothetical protein